MTTAPTYHGAKCKRGHTLRYTSCGACVPCCATANRRWHKENREMSIAKKKAYYYGNHAHNLQVARRRYRRIWGDRLQRLYGITATEFTALEAKQKGVCAICKKPNIKRKRLSVDHEHSSKHVRGLLCTPCNLGLGYFKDNPTALLSAIAYLKSSKQRSKGNGRHGEK